MASEQLRYTSQEDAEEAVKRLNVGGLGGFVIRQEAESNGNKSWHVQASPPVCPVRGVALSTIPIAPWRNEYDEDTRQRKLAESRALKFAIAALPLGAVTVLCSLKNLEWCAVILLLPLSAVSFGLCVNLLRAGLSYRKWNNANPHFVCECGMSIAANVEWICGKCKSKNARPFGAWFSFIDKCRGCTAVPAAFVCYHCGRVIPLIAGGDFRHPAYASDGHGESQKTDRHSERIAEAERQKLEFEKEIEALKAETKVAITAKGLEEARAKLRETTSNEFERRMSDVEKFSLGDDEILRAGAAEQAKIQASDLDASIKKVRIDRLQRYVMAKLSERKPR